MPSATTKKRARSPEVDGLTSTRQSTSIRIHQNTPLKRRCRGPKDDRIKALQKLRRRIHFRDTAYEPITSRTPQLTTRVHRTAPDPVSSPLQLSPEPAALHSPPALLVGGDGDGPESFNDTPESFSDTPESSHVPLGSGLRTASSKRDNRALFRQTRHLDDHTSAWNGCCNNQATQWKSVTIPQLIPTYLANRASTELLWNRILQERYHNNYALTHAALFIITV